MKAKKEFNYARFFSILKSPSTPYLFGCLMFKHVELMRKAAFRIMSKTFGARKKDTGEAIYDAYPLARLVDLLCFENADEARNACKHYNITVKPMKMTSSSGKVQVAEIIFWRNTDFSEPKNPEKGTTLPLQPWKMVKTIEKKLNGATRLAVCRGDVSGDGATLASTHPPFAGSYSVGNSVTNDQDAMKREKEMLEQARRVEETRKREEERRLLEERKKQEAERRLAEAKKKELERQKRLEEEKEREAEKQRLAELQRKLFEEEKKKLEEEEKRKLEEERIRKIEAEARKVREAEQRKQEEEARRRQLEEEEARRKAEALERARREEAERLEKERQQRLAEIAQKEKEEQERLRREAEAARLEMIRIQEEERKRKEAEERKQALEWKNSVNSARKKVIWLRWRNMIARRLEMTKGSSTCLGAIDPTFSNANSGMAVAIRQTLSDTNSYEETFSSLGPLDSRRMIERLIKKTGKTMNLATMVLDTLRNSSMFRRGGKPTNKKSTILLKVAVIIPQASTSQEESMRQLLIRWVDSRFKFGRIVADGLDGGVECQTEVRTVVKLDSERTAHSNADVALFLLPEHWTTSNVLSSFQFDSNIPRVAFVLCKNLGDTREDYLSSEIPSYFSSSAASASMVFPSSFPEEMPEDGFDESLVAAFEEVVKKFLRDTIIYMDRCTVSDLGAIVVREALWGAGHITANPSNDCNAISVYAKSALLTMISEIEKLRRANEGDWSAWPPPEFAEGQSRIVSNYFEQGGLPLDWEDRLLKEYLEMNIAGFFDSFDGSFRAVMERYLKDSPLFLREECSILLGKRQYKRCLERALAWRHRPNGSSRGDEKYIYLPRGLTELIVQNTLDTLRREHDENTLPTYRLVRHVLDPVEGQRDDVLMLRGSSNAVETPLSVSGNLLSKRRWEETLSGGDGGGGDANRNGGYDDDVDNDDNENRNDNNNAEEGIVTKKRRDDDNYNLYSMSKEQQESSAFTKRLQALLDGDTVDMSVGETTLKSLLRSVPKL